MHKQVYKCLNHTANLNNMRLNNRWCDLTIKVDGKEFRAHKNILAANLQYFEGMLLGDSFRESKEGVITMQYVNPKDLEAFITYAYTGEISLTDDNALSLLETANYLGEDGIKGACTEFLQDHLKVEESLRAYDVAKSIDCHSLKNAAKSRILSSFESLSQSSEFLDLDFERLADFLSDGKTRPVQSQQIFFEGVMRWIMRDAKKRRMRINDLLSFVDVSKLPMDYLVKYVGRIACRHDDDSGIVVKDLMCWYYTRSKSEPITKKLKVAHSEQALAILGRVDGKFSFQSYSFAESKDDLSDNIAFYFINVALKALAMKWKWSQPQSITISNELISSCAVLNDKFYFISEKSGSRSLNMFDPSTKLRTALHSSSNILSDAALCACSRFVYLCGGWGQDSRSDQVLRYDPQTNSFEILPPMLTRQSSVAAVFYRGCLHVLGGCDGSSVITNKVEKYDSGTKKWMGLPSMCEPRLGHSAAVLDGKLYACGGYCTSSVEVYEPAENSWQRVASMNRKRWDFTLVAHEGKLLAIGRWDEKSIEVYDPSKDQWQMDAEVSSRLQINGNMGGLISSSCVADAK